MHIRQVDHRDTTNVCNLREIQMITRKMKLFFAIEIPDFNLVSN